MDEAQKVADDYEQQIIRYVFSSILLTFLNFRCFLLCCSLLILLFVVLFADIALIINFHISIALLL